MPKVELRGVEEVGEGGPGGIEDPVPDLDVGVAECIDDVKEDQVGSDHCPVLGSKGKKGDEHGRTEIHYVENVLDKVLDSASGWEGVDGLVMMTMHADHLTGDMEPPVGCIVEGLDEEHVEDEGREGGAGIHFFNGGEEHTREEALENHLAIHVHHHRDQVVVALAIELPLTELHHIGGLFILQREASMGQDSF